MASVLEHFSLRLSNLLLRPGILFLFLVLISARAFGAGATLAWDPVSDPSVAGYKVYYGTAAGSYMSSIDVGNKTSYIVPNLVEGVTYHFAATAYDTAHVESGFSNDASATIPHSALAAQFSASTCSGIAPLAMNFVSTSTGTITGYTWTFGDGGTSSAQHPSHVYSSAGSYTVGLTVTGPAGNNTKTIANYINVSAAPPVAAFTASATSGYAPLPVNFTSTSTGSITAYAWDFGDGATSSAKNPSHTYSSSGAYTVRLAVTGPGGSNTETSANLITVTAPATVSGCPCSIWSSASVPTVAADPDRNAVELGVKFKADRNGSLTGIRFYKSSTNTGTHVASLWTNRGRLLARATFTNETASGWQQVKFATPVAIAANVVYVASYHTNAGHYAGDNNYFATAGVDNGPLHALRNGATGGNGVYRYGPVPTFPNSSYMSTNYWVDVVFAPAN